MVIANAARNVDTDAHRVAAIGTAQMPDEPFCFELFFQSYPIESEFPELCPSRDNPVGCRPRSRH